MRPLKNLCEIAVIGGGIAGLSAARHAVRLGCLVTLFDGSGLYGGLLATVGDVHGLPVPGQFSGMSLAMAMLEDSQKLGMLAVQSDVKALEVDDRLTLTIEDGTSYHPEAVIVACGAQLRTLNIPGESEFAGRGVSRCATCDGGIFRGDDVAVIGGGDAAVHEALVLAKTSRSVTMICRSALRAKREYIDKLDSCDNVRFIWDHEVTAIEGSDVVTGLSVRNVKTGEASQIACAGVFPFIGVEPRIGLLRPTTQSGSGNKDADSRIFAAGAVRPDYGGTVIEAMAQGVAAASAAAQFLGKVGQSA